jgi:hypothetical protein
MDYDKVDDKDHKIGSSSGHSLVYHITDHALELELDRQEKEMRLNMQKERYAEKRLMSLIEEYSILDARFKWVTSSLLFKKNQKMYFVYTRDPIIASFAKDVHDIYPDHSINKIAKNVVIRFKNVYL